MTERIAGTTSLGVWAAYAAAACAFLFAAVSFYWAVGGTAGLDTLGGRIEELARARDPGMIALGWITGALKVFGGLLALALVRPWGRWFPRWMLLISAWGASAILALYGGVLVVSATLVVIGVVRPTVPVDWTALRWHLALWDSWFLVWGILLGLAARHYARQR